MTFSEQLERLRELEGKATLSPWPTQTITWPNGYTVHRVFVKCDPERDAHDLLDFGRKEDADFLSELRNLAPSLIKRAELLDKVMKHTEIVLKGTNAPSTWGKFLEEYRALEKENG